MLVMREAKIKEMQSKLLLTIIHGQLFTLSLPLVPSTIRHLHIVIFLITSAVNVIISINFFFLLALKVFTLAIYLVNRKE